MDHGLDPLQFPFVFASNDLLDQIPDHESLSLDKHRNAGRSEEWSHGKRHSPILPIETSPLKNYYIIDKALFQQTKKPGKEISAGLPLARSP
jgi:hypothetical protein